MSPSRYPRRNSSPHWLALRLATVLTIGIGLGAHASELPAFRVLVDADHPPFSYANTSGEAQGITVQMLDAVLTRMNQPVRIEAVPWRRAALLATTTPNLLLASVMQLPERKTQYLWLGQLFQESISLYALKSRRLQIRDIEALYALSIGTRRESAGYRQLVKLGVPASHIHVVDDPLQNLRKLQTGRLDLITLQPSVLDWHAHHLGVPTEQFEPVYSLLPKTSFQLAASRNTDPMLVAAVQHALKQLEADGSLPRIRAQAQLDTNNALSN